MRLPPATLILLLAGLVLLRPAGSFGQDAPASAGKPASAFPPLEVGHPLPKAWLRQFKSEGLRQWIEANVVCQRQPLSYDRFGISAGRQLLITPEVFNGPGLTDNQRINLLAFELGKVFYTQVIEADPALRGRTASFSTGAMQVVPYHGVALVGDSPQSLNLGDMDTASQFSYVFRVELLKVPPGKADWGETRKDFHALVDPITRNARLSENSALLGNWTMQSRSYAQEVAMRDLTQGRAERWKALVAWTQSACDYMTQADISDLGPQAARDEADSVKSYRTYLLNDFVVLSDEEIGAGLDAYGDSLRPCQKSLIAVIRSATAPIDAAWLVAQMDEQRAAYNAQLKADADAYRQRIDNARDPVVDFVQAIYGVVSQGAAALVSGITAPFVYTGGSDGGGRSYSSPGRGGSGQSGSPGMGSAYQRLKGIAAAGGGIPLQ